MKASLSAWDRSHEDKIRAALVPSRGASTIRRNPVWNGSIDVFKEVLGLVSPDPRVSHYGRHPYQ
eukprot:137936-Pelagomonas_calceolata.AAC.1